MHRARRPVVAAVSMGIGLAMLASPVVAADRSVRIVGFAFSPATLTVRVGDSVTWRNEDSAAHTATSAGAWNSGDLGRGESATITFRAAGSFEYMCGIHPAMTGRVVVQAGGTAPPTDTADAAPGSSRDPSTARLAVLVLAAVIAAVLADRRSRSRLKADR